MKKTGKYTVITAIVSIGFFITIIAIAGLLLFHPDSASFRISDKTVPNSVDTDNETLFNPHEYFQNLSEDTEESSIVEDTAADEIELAITAAVDSHVTGNALQKTVQPSSNLNTAVTDSSPVVHSARSTTHIPTTTRTPSASLATAPKIAMASAKSVIASASHTKSAPSTIMRNAAPPDTRATHTYWVQLFSSDRHERTDRAQATLARYQVDGIISDHTINGIRYYRLRIGPYTEYHEAQKFLAWLNQGDIFSNGYVVQADQ